MHGPHADAFHARECFNNGCVIHLRQALEPHLAVARKTGQFPNVSGLLLGKTQFTQRRHTELEHGLGCHGISLHGLRQTIEDSERGFTTQLLIHDGAHQRLENGLTVLDLVGSRALDHGGENRIGGFQMTDGFSHGSFLAKLAGLRTHHTVHMKRFSILCGVATVLGCACAILAQDEPIRVDVNLVSILASVRGKSGGLLSNLQQTDFKIFEDGKEQTIKNFTRETDLPLTIGLLVDTSGSQERLIDTEQRAASQFFSKVLRQKDEAFLIQFGAEAELLQDSTNSPRLLQKGLEQLRLSVPVGGLHPGPVPTAQNQAGTVLYDAVYLAANERLRKEVGRKAIVLITDGVDTGSKTTRDKAIEAAQKADAIIYSIYYVDRGAYGFGGFGGGGEGDLRRMSTETGGQVFHVDRGHSLDDIFRAIQEEMRSQYAITYQPPNPNRDGAYHKIDVRMSNKDYKVQARKGYYAIEPEN